MTDHAPLPKRWARPLRLLAFGLGLSIAAASAQEPAAPTDACAGFKWPLERERTWFSAPGLGRIVAGGALQPDLPAAVIGLRRLADAELPHTPTREPKPGTYAGAISLSAPATAGLYQVTLSDEGWIDVFQDGASKAPVDHTGKRDCPGLRKSVRYQLGTQPIVVEITGARAETVRLAVTRAEEAR